MFFKFKAVTILLVLFLATTVVARESVLFSAPNPAFLMIHLRSEKWATNSYGTSFAHRLFRLAEQSGAMVHETYAKSIFLSGDQPFSAVDIRVYEKGQGSPNEGVYFNLPVASFQPPAWYGSLIPAFEITEKIVFFSGPAARTLYLMLLENVKKGFLEKSESNYLGAGNTGMINETVIDDKEVISCGLQVLEKQQNYYRCTFKLSR